MRGFVAVTTRPTTVDECAQMRLYRDEVLDFWRHHPGEKAKLALQANTLREFMTPKQLKGDSNAR